VDAFDASRDEILLDDNAEEDPRLDEFDGDTHEVLGMNLDDEDNDSDDESDHNVGDEQDDEKEEDDDLDRYRTMILPSSVTESSLRRRAARDDAHKEQEEEDILENDGDDDENELYLHRFVAGIGARDPNKSSSTSTASLKRLVLLEPVDVAGEVSLLLVLPFRKRGETSVRVTVVEVSEAEDNTDVDMWVR